ncbi:extracellular solute-binding protein [Nocardiopsis nanhaiensis]
MGSNPVSGNVKRTARSASAALVLVLALTACGAFEDDADESDEGVLTLYSGREEENIDPLVEEFQEETGIELDVRYGDSAEMTAQILEEGEATPADVFFTLEVGGINALAEAGQIATLSDGVLSEVPEEYQADDGSWVATSARARVIAHNPDVLSPGELPEGIDELTDERWQGEVGFAPSNSSFQSFVSGLRTIEGDDWTAEWLTDFAANDPEPFDNNRAIIEGVENNTVEIGMVNHYYHIVQTEEFGEENVHWEPHHITGGDPLGLVVIAGISVLESSDMQDEANELVEFMVSETAQQHFADDTAEYPIREGVESTQHDLVPLSELSPPAMELGEVASMEGTLDMLQDAGLL